MGFESIFKSSMKGSVNRSEFNLSSKERPHISKAKIDANANAKYIEIGTLEYARYTSELDERYMAATNITYDMLLSLHGVNTRRSLIYRTFQEADLLGTAIKGKIAALGKRDKIEARIIGLQNGQELGALIEMAEFITANGIKLVEVDIFGANTRHVAIDTKLGMSLNILMENRIYRPGELSNQMTIENLEASIAAKSAAQKNEPKRRGLLKL